MKVITKKQEIKIDTKTEEVENEGLISLLGKNVIVFVTDGYIYFGELTGVNTNDIRISNAKIVYETGKWDSNTFVDAQAIPCPHVYIRSSQITSYFVSPKQ